MLSDLILLFGILGAVWFALMSENGVFDPEPPPDNSLWGAMERSRRND